MEWISTKDKDPENNDHYMVAREENKKEVFPAYWDGECFGNMIGILEWHPYENITHWMPKPIHPNL